MSITESPVAPNEVQHASRSARRTRTQELFRHLQSSSDPVERDRIREQVTTLNMGVAQSVAHRYSGRGELNDDLEQVAYLGLVKAVNGFDGTYHKDFLTYAVPTISGELKKHFRDHCWTVRPPRRIQDLQRRIASASEKLNQVYDHPPSISAIATELGVDDAEVNEALAADGCFTPASLDLPVGQSTSTSVSELIGDEDAGFDEVETHLALAPVISELRDRDRDIIQLRYFHDWTQDRIAQQLGITQMQVSRLLSRIMRTLHEQLADGTGTTTRAE